MGLVSRAMRFRADTTTADAWRRALGMGGGGGATKAGVHVSDSVAEAYSAVFGCRRVVSEDVAKLPLKLYQRVPGGKKPATDHPLYYLVHDAPNDFQTSFEWREMQQGGFEFRGNCFSFVNRIGKEVREIIPLNPDTVTPRFLANWRVEYDVKGDKVRTPGEILHVRGYSNDGLNGISVLRAAREAVGLAVAAERHGGRLFTNGARLSMVAQHPDEFSDEAVERIKEGIVAAGTGENLGGVLMLENGVTLNSAPITMTNDDAQFLETRQFQVPEICRYWRIPPHKIADLTRATFSNIEHQALEYVIDSLMPRLVRWEQRMNRTLLLPSERREFFFEFTTDALLRGDTATRYAAHQIAFLNGIKNRNEIRAQENLNPVEGGDEFRVPANTLPALPSLLPLAA